MRLATTAAMTPVDEVDNLRAYSIRCKKRQMGSNLHILCLPLVYPMEVPLALSNLDFDCCVSQAPGASLGPTLTRPYHVSLKLPRKHHRLHRRLGFALSKTK